MRVSALAACLLSASAVAGCGSDTSVELVWGGPPKPDANGVVSTDGFASFQESVDDDWEHSPATAAAEFLRLDKRAAATTSVVASGSAEGTGAQTVVVTLDGLPDDSVRAERWRLAFDENDGVYTLTSALWEQRCRPGRGHVGYAPGPCV